MQTPIRELAASVTHLVRTSPVKLAVQRARNRRHATRATGGPRFVSTSVQARTLPNGHARTLLGKPGTLGIGSPLKMLKPRYLSARMQRVYKRDTRYSV